ncbi:hypothetical protein [Roseivirga sp.]|uniref:hypothetical protein n=1 Tax=Roseivirga sp. TaxID=1964215 RepID=UPI003B51D56B
MKSILGQTSVDFVLSNVPNVLSWNLDFEDADQVLRIEMEEESFGHEIPNALSEFGIICEELI